MALIYQHADLALKNKQPVGPLPLGVKPARYRRASDTLLPYLEDL